MSGPTIDATVGGASANSYETLAEAKTYFTTRLPLAGWDNADSQSGLLIMATRTLDSLLQPRKNFYPAANGKPAYYRISPQWTGLPATATQRLAWPRIGMFDKNGNAIPSNVIPQDLKDVESEFAGQLGNADRTLDSDVIVQGITAVRAGSVSVSFSGVAVPQVLPDAVWNLMPQSWFTDELYELADGAFIEVVSGPTPHSHGGWWY